MELWEGEGMKRRHRSSRPSPPFATSPLGVSHFRQLGLFCWCYSWKDMQGYKRRELHFHFATTTCLRILWYRKEGTTYPLRWFP
ncbi:hypothetical protein MRB53_026553 [Persea americana]|uniref:Uncharacterized protein n=1 Tax=Persea americana TaxID=3435 RepID=A0ACC2LII8_PERAE|nr:hypothetical protein MRB53_026553 [Persea americana]